jgi:hypothetical protein
MYPTTAAQGTVQIYYNGTSLVFEGFSGSSGGYYNIGQYAATSGVNYYIVIIFTGTTIYTYVDNVLWRTTTLAQSLVNDTSYRIGSLGSYNGGGYTSMTVYDFRIMNTVLTASDIVATDFYADRLGNLLTAPVTGIHLKNWLGSATGYVTKWYDQSGTNHATQDTSASQPIIQRATKGPGYSCLFNGTQFLTGMSHTVLNGTNYTVNFIERRGINNSGELPVITSGSAAGNGKVLILLYNNSTKFSHSQWGTEPTYSYGAAVPAYSGASEPVRYWSADFSQVSQEHLYLNGSLFATTSTQFAPLASTAGNFNIGNFPSSSSYYTGEIYEIIVFTRSLYDLDGTSTINQIYQNQLGAYGT